MIKITSQVILTVYLAFCLSSPSFARKLTSDDDQVQTINSNIEVQIFSIKKTRKYTAVEVGFTNTSNLYTEFSPKEIYLDDHVKYSLPLLTMDEIEEIQHNKPGNAIFPTALAVGLGIAAIGVSRSNSSVAFGLAMGAAGAGGAALLTKGLENRHSQNKLIAFQNNRIDDIKRLPPGMTLGGVLYFPPTKKPKSITIISKKKSAGYKRNVFNILK